MFWPDDRTLQDQAWWAEPAWTDGPTFGALVAAVRPAIRAALLLGWETDAVGLGFGTGIALDGEWQVIVRDGLQLLPGPDLSVEKQAEGPTLWLEVTSIGDIGMDLGGEEPGESPVDHADLFEDDLAGTYAIEFDFGLLGSDGYTLDGTVPAAITAAVSDVVERAVQALAQRIPTRDQWNDAGKRLAREASGGLLWILDPGQWYGVGTGEEEGELSPVAAELLPVVEELIEEREAFLRGQFHADREQHHPPDGPGPANLRFLLGRERFWSGRAHNRFWEGLLAELQARGESHRLWERERTRFTDLDGPTWLDVLSELLGRGVIRIFGLFEAGEPPTPLAVTAPTGDAEEQVTLTVWGGATITLRRQTVFADQWSEGLTGSAAWNYTPGVAQVKPTVILVAGRGIAIEHNIGTLDGRPWTLEIFRVQDDRLVPRLGAQIDPTALLSTTQIEPQPNECVFDPEDAVAPDTLLFPQIMVKPKPDGVTIVYPVSEGTIQNQVLAPAGTPVVPSVIELTVGPLSGTAAYAIDARYYTDLHMNIPELVMFNGGVQVMVWVTGDVGITAYRSLNETPARGNPSGITREVNGHLFVAEFWEVEVQAQHPPSALTAARLGDQPHPLPRPWSVELPTTRWADLFPTPRWQAMLEEAWEGLVLQQIQDIFEPFREDPFADEDVPHLDYDHGAQLAVWHDPVSGADYVLTPAAHKHGDFGAMDSLFLDLVDVGVSLIPFVGDAADIGELVYAWQTGRDRWGRPVTNFQLGLMMAGSALPFVSSAFMRGAAEFLRQLPQAPPDAARFRLLTSAFWKADLPVEGVEAAMTQSSVVHRATLESGSRSRRDATEDLIVKLADDSSLPTGSAAAMLASRLIDGTQDGWLTVDDLVSDDGAGFALTSLQTTYTRFLRDNPGVSPLEWIGMADGG